MRLLKTFIIALLCLIPHLNIYADTDPITTPLDVEDTDTESDPGDIGPRRHRIPPRPVMCTIDFSSCRVVISNGVDTQSILEFEIADCEDLSLMVFYEESEFVTGLSSLPSGDYIIRFRLPDRTLKGYLSM